MNHLIDHDKIAELSEAAEAEGLPADVVTVLEDVAAGISLGNWFDVARNLTACTLLAAIDRDAIARGER